MAYTSEEQQERAARVLQHFNNLWGQIQESAGIQSERFQGGGTAIAVSPEVQRAEREWATKPGKVGPEPEFKGIAEELDVAVPEGATNEYVELADKLGMPMTKDVRVKLFNDFLRKNEIVVYNLADVEAYLWKRCKWLNDKNKMDATSISSGERHTWKWMSAKMYAQEATVPIEAMRVMDQVSAFSSAQAPMEFGVSKIDKDPDPFLSVSFMGVRYVLFHWDEPGFSVTK